MTLVFVPPKSLTELAKDLAGAAGKIAGIQQKMLINDLPEIELNFEKARKFTDHIKAWADKADIEYDRQVAAKKREKLVRSQAQIKHAEVEKSVEKPTKKRKKTDQ